jgi:hypothetical protein
MVGSTPHPDEAFMLQIARHLTEGTDGVLDGPRFLICDRDRKWSSAVRHLLETSGVRVIRPPFRAPNHNAHAERRVRSDKEACLKRVIRLGERHFRRTVAEFVVHYHRECNYQGLGSELIDGVGGQHRRGRVWRRQRVGGLLSYDYHAASPTVARIRSAELSDTTRLRCFNAPRTAVAPAVMPRGLK